MARRQGVSMGDHALGDLWCFNTETRVWTELKCPDAPEKRSYHQMISVGDELFVFGGCGVGGRLSDLHSFNVTTKKWSRMPDPQYPGHIVGRGGASFMVCVCVCVCDRMRSKSPCFIPLTTLVHILANIFSPLVTVER